MTQLCCSIAGHLILKMQIVLTDSVSAKKLHTKLLRIMIYQSRFLTRQQTQLLLSLSLLVCSASTCEDWCCCTCTKQQHKKQHKQLSHTQATIPTTKTPNTLICIVRVRKLEGGLLTYNKYNITFTEQNIATNINTHNKKTTNGQNPHKQTHTYHSFQPIHTTTTFSIISTTLDRE